MGNVQIKYVTYLLLVFVEGDILGNLIMECLLTSKNMINLEKPPEVGTKWILTGCNYVGD